MPFGVAQLAHQLDPLRLAAREGGARLSQREVSQPQVLEYPQGFYDLPEGVEPVRRFLDRHGQNVPDAPAFILGRQRFAVEPAAPARLARHEDVGQEVHLDAHLALSLAVLASPALHVEGKPPGRVAPRLRFGKRREELSDVVPDAYVGGRRGPGSAADRVVVDFQHALDGLVTGHALQGGPRPLVDSAEPLLESVVDHFPHERALPRTGHPGHAGERPQRNPRIDSLEIVRSRSEDFQPPVLAGLPAGGDLEEGYGEMNLPMTTNMHSKRNHLESVFHYILIMNTVKSKRFYYLSFVAACEGMI